MAYQHRWTTSLDSLDDVGSVQNDFLSENVLFVQTFTPLCSIVVTRNLQFNQMSNMTRLFPFERFAEDGVQ